MALLTALTGDKRVDLGKIDPKADGGLTKEEGIARFDELTLELGELQELLYAAQQQSVLIVLQGLDTSGKDGTIRSVLDEINPVGVRVASFKVPTDEELAHDFLWRVHPKTPGRGEFTVFNRSHYEDVLIVRVHELVPEAVWRPRYDHIKAFERLVADNQTIIAKFFLHISKEEQEERLLEREADVSNSWKLSAGDWVERQSWERYIEAYEDAINACAQPHAPWFVVPADRKWFRNLAIAETIVGLLRPYKDEWLKTLHDRGQDEKLVIAEARAKRT
jgi:PPK2 family polyphosphate:nucleotide phosphotransferase